MIYQILDDAHVLIEDGGKTWLLDTGSPNSCSQYGCISFAGKEYPVSTSIMGLVTPQTLSTYVHHHIDGLIGMDILGKHNLFIQTQKKCLCVDETVSLREMTEVPLTFRQGIPIVNGEIEGTMLSFAFDTGAQLTYAMKKVLAEKPIVGEKEDFYPLFGKFTTQIALSNLEIAQHQIELQMGQLPTLLEGLLTMLGIKGILGRNFLDACEVLLTHDQKLYVRKSE